MERIKVEVVPASPTESGYYTVILRSGIKLDTPKSNINLEFDKSVSLDFVISRLTDHYHSESTLILTEVGDLVESEIESEVETEKEDDDLYW